MVNRSSWRAAGIAIVLASAASAVQGGVSVHTGPTPIPGGNAQGARDITLVNERLAVAFAVETAPPWGVARGGIIDVAEVRQGVIAPDRAALVDFMPNDWSSWPTTYQRVIIEKQTPQEVILRTERDWEGVALVTTWRLAAGEDTLHMRTRMINRSDKSYPALLSGYVSWPEGGYLFGVPGSGNIHEGLTPDRGAHWSAAVDRDWLMGLHAPFADRVGDDSRDRYLQHALAPGETHEFEGWLQVGPRGELAPLVAREIAREKRPAGTLSGRASTRAGQPVATPAVIVEKQADGAFFPFTWALGDAGSYSLQLPAGSYRVYATAEGHSDSQPVMIEIRGGAKLTQDFADLEPPGELELHALATGSRAPLDARISIAQGKLPLIPYFGRSTFFTELNPAGQLALSIAPGDYRFKVEAVAGFRAVPVFVNARVAPGSRQLLEAPVELRADPAAEGWYGGDMHHHSDVLDGFSPPEFVLRSQLAAGLDITLLSDHDAVVNNRELNRLSLLRGKPFIAATEFSPSWAHFNAYPLDAEAEITIDVGRSTVQQIFAEARRMGARVIQANHPYINYGYFRSQRDNAIPGGYSPDFDLVEVNGGDKNEETVRHAWRLWNTERKAYYLSAGSDAHDVWREASGTARMYVKIDGPLGIDSFVAALKRGNAYASQGPLVFPRRMFGETVKHPAGTPLALDFELQSVSGLAKAQLIERGELRDQHEFAAAPSARTAVTFTVTPHADTWYSLVVQDAAGRHAWTNPIWVETE